MPITVVNDLLFIQAEVGGVAGKVMFDTGTPEGLVLNDHLLHILDQERRWANRAK